MRQATRSNTPIGASETPSICAAYQAISPRSALMLLRLFHGANVRVLFPHGESEIALRLPGLRLRLQPLAGTVRRLRRVEHAHSGERGGVEHLRGEAQFAGRRTGDPPRRPRDAGGAAG